MATVALSGIITPTNVVTATSTTTLTNKTLTGAVVNGTVGATTPSTGAFTSVTTTGNVGVGTASPQQRLHIQDATQIRNVVSTGNNELQFWKDSTPTFAAGIGCGVVASGLVSALVFETYLDGGAWTERARIPSTGGIQSVNSISVGNATPTTSGAGITFPATQSASTDANTLDDYEEGSFTFTGTGFTTSPTKTAYYTKIGDQVTVQLPDITGTSNTTAMTITGLPVALRSARAYTFSGLVYNASVINNGYFYGAHANAVTVYWNAVSDAFTASGVKGIPNNLSITYTIN
jgi:hypothetical protein